ncbi:MAG: flippase-like domain-containing protein [Halobacteriovoraceae bacterium]|nr:flippase-like domain-containing protein [Halobacteriovoraceae bacterium]
MKAPKSVIKFLLKLFFSIGIVYWLVDQGKLDLDIFIQSLQNPWRWVVAISFLIVAISIGGIRLQILLKSFDHEVLEIKKSIAITWIGSFFNIVLPGTVTGDGIKFFYIKDQIPSAKKTHIVSMLLIDRILGLISLFLIMGVLSLYYYNDLAHRSENLKNLIIFNSFILGSLLIAGIFILYPSTLKTYLWSKILQYSAKFKIQDIIKNLPPTDNSPRAILKILFWAFISQIFIISSFNILITPYLTADISLGHLYTFVPIGFFLISIPISPQGIGVGHLSFDFLFSLFGQNKGASLFNFFLFSNIAANLLGVFPYLFYAKKHREEHSVKENI